MSVTPTPAREPMPHHFLAWPSTHDGKLAAWLSVVPPGLSMVIGLIGAAGAYDWSRTVRIGVLLIPTLGMLLCSLVAGVLAVLALRKGDRSVVLLWPLLLGVSVVLLVVGEFAVRH
jgi:hypothetical protein